jgi:5-methylcytosine-specific restriction endonuclease McrA
MPSSDPIKRREQHRNWYLANAEKCRTDSAAWHLANAEKCKANAAAWAHAHPGKRRIISAAWRLANAERHRANNAAWALAHPNNRKASSHARRARRRGNGGSFTAAQWIALLTLYGRKCLGCGRGEAELNSLGLKLVPDHIHSLKTGGANDIGNIQPLCHGMRGCNNRKGAKFIDYRIAFLCPLIYHGESFTYATQDPYPYRTTLSPFI